MQDRKFGKSGDKIVIEEYLEGPEVSVLAFTDGKTVKPMVSSMDHKRIGDGDKGLNVEKKPALAHEANSLKNELISLLGIKGIDDLRIINRYDAENIDE